MTSEKKVGYHPGGSVPRRGRTTSRRRPTGRTVYKSRTTIPTTKRGDLNPTPKRLAKPTTQTPRQKAIAGAKALTPKQRQATNKATPTKTNRWWGSKTGTLGKPTTLGAAMARRKAQAATPQNAANAAMARRTNAKYGRRKPTGRTVYKSRTTIPTRPTARRTAKPARGRVGQSLNRYMQARRTNAKLGRPTGRTVAGRFKKTPGAAIPKRSTATSGKRSRDYSLGRRRFT